MKKVGFMILAMALITVNMYVMANMYEKNSYAKHSDKKQEVAYEQPPVVLNNTALVCLLNSEQSKLEGVLFAGLSQDGKKILVYRLNLSYGESQFASEAYLPMKLGNPTELVEQKLKNALGIKPKFWVALENTNDYTKNRSINKNDYYFQLVKLIADNKVKTNVAMADISVWLPKVEEMMNKEIVLVDVYIIENT